MNNQSKHYNNLVTSLMLKISAPTEEEAREGAAAAEVFAKYFSEAELASAKSEALARLETDKYPMRS
jgi:hypothetical protein